LQRIQEGARVMTAADAGAGRDQWWENSSHEDGSAWIHDGSTGSPILTPEQFGL
jgi:hypothetical protein